MAAPLEQIMTLHPDNVLFELYNAVYLSGINNVSIGMVLLVGANVTDWATNDVIIYNKDLSYQFHAHGETYSVIHNDGILLKYIPEVSGLLPVT